MLYIEQKGANWKVKLCFIVFKVLLSMKFIRLRNSKFEIFFIFENDHLRIVSVDGSSWISLKPVFSQDFRFHLKY